MRKSLLLSLLGLTAMAGWSSGPTAGICFRADDNYTPERWRAYMAVFDRYGYKGCGSFNLVRVTPGSDYVTMLKQFQAQGHELMDHTPWHRLRIISFPTTEEAQKYASNPGVDHAAGKNLYLRFVPITAGKKKPESGRIVKGALFPEKSSTWKPAQQPYIYLPATRQMLLTVPDKNDKDRLQLKTFWDEPITGMADIDKAEFITFNGAELRLTDAAMTLLAEVTAAKCREFGLRPPETWIQPGGTAMLQLNAVDFQRVYVAKFGYQNADANPRSIKVFGEYDPQGLKRYGMKWGDFFDDTKDVEWNLKRIADGVARHHVMFGHCHFPKTDAEFKAYLDRVDRILSWCKARNIPVKTMSEWGEELYARRVVLTGNILPPLTVDHDGDRVSDGYQIAAGLDPKTGTLQRTGDGVLAEINGLGGWGGRQYRLSIQIKAPSATSVTAVLRLKRDVKDNQNDVIHKLITMGAQNGEWQLGTLNFTAPEWVSLADLKITVHGSGQNSVFLKDLQLLNQTSAPAIKGK